MVELNEHIKAFQQVIGVDFDDPEVLRRALTHRSYVNENEDETEDNERLEFLGDAILDFVVADMLFARFPDVAEGELTQLRSALVRTESLADMAINFQVGEYLLIGKGEENSGGRTRVNNLCRGFEAIIGAVYIDQGLRGVRDFILPSLEAYLQYVLENSLHKDARSVLQERSQAELRFTPVYRLIDAAGPDHEKEFLIEVVVGSLVIGQGVGTSKRAAAQAAARDALVRLEEQGWPAEAELAEVSSSREEPDVSHDKTPEE